MNQFEQQEFEELDFARGCKLQLTEEMHRGFETALLNLGIAYAKLYSVAPKEFRKRFIERPSYQRACGLIYWAYRLHNLVEEVQAEEGERRERLYARRIKKVFEEIMSEETSCINKISEVE